MSEGYYSFTQQNVVSVTQRDQQQFQSYSENNYHQHYSNQQSQRQFQTELEVHRPLVNKKYSSHGELGFNPTQNEFKHNDLRSTILTEQQDNLATKQLQFSVNVNSISLPTKDMLDTREEAREYRIIGENRTFYTRSTNLSTKLQTLKEKEKIKENKNIQEQEQPKNTMSDDKNLEGLILPQNDGVCEDESIADLFEIDKNNRYFLQDQKKQQVCRRCKQSGHLERMCLMEAKSVCNACLAKDHISNKCPQRVCFTCNQFGHINRDCPYQNDRKCHRCMKVGHTRQDCGAIVLARRANAGRDDQEMTDSDYMKVICQGCGNRGHLNCRDTLGLNGKENDDGLYGKEFLERMAKLKSKEENKRLAESLSDVNMNDEEGQIREDKQNYKEESSKQSSSQQQQRKRRHDSRDRDNRDDSCNYERREQQQSLQNPRKQFKRRSNSRSQSNGRRYQGQSKSNQTHKQADSYSREDHQHHNVDYQRQSQHHYGQNHTSQGGYYQREQTQNGQNYQTMNYSREAGSYQQRETGSYQQREQQQQQHYHNNHNSGRYHQQHNNNNNNSSKEYHQHQNSNINYNYNNTNNNSNNNNNQGIGYQHDRQLHQQYSQRSNRDYERQQQIIQESYTPVSYTPVSNQREPPAVQGGYQYSSLTQPTNQQQKQGYQYSSVAQRYERYDQNNYNGQSRQRQYQ